MKPKKVSLRRDLILAENPRQISNYLDTDSDIRLVHRILGILRKEVDTGWLS